MMEISIADFHTSLYIQDVKTLASHRPHVLIIGTSHCGNKHRELLKRRSANQDLLCRRD